VNQDLSPIFLSGTVTKADSTAASGQQLNIVNGGSEQTVLTNSSGGYNVSVSRNSKVAIGYRHTNGGAELAPEFDDTPDHHYAASLQVGETSQTHDVQLPTAYRVNVTVVDESNTPVENASVDVISYRSSDRNSAFGTGPTLTNSDGQLAYENGSGPGIELSGPAAVIVERPENDTRFENTTYTRELNVTSDTEVTVTSTGDVALGYLEYGSKDASANPTFGPGEIKKDEDFATGDSVKITRGYGYMVPVTLEGGTSAVTASDPLTTGASGKLKAAGDLAVSVPAGTTTVQSTAAQPDLTESGAIPPEPVQAYAMESGDPSGGADAEIFAMLAI
jgi:hypothetical protein